MTHTEVFWLTSVAWMMFCCASYRIGKRQGALKVYDEWKKDLEERVAERENERAIRRQGRPHEQSSP